MTKPCRSSNESSWNSWLILHLLKGRRIVMSLRLRLTESTVNIPLSFQSWMHRRVLHHLLQPISCQMSILTTKPEEALNENKYPVKYEQVVIKAFFLVKSPLNFVYCGFTSFYYWVSVFASLRKSTQFIEMLKKFGKICSKHCQSLSKQNRRFTTETLFGTQKREKLAFTMNDVLDGNSKEQFYNSQFNLAFSDIFRPPKEWTDQNDVDITVDVELQREEFYRIKKSSTSLFFVSRTKRI